jgi:uncharacterized membrane protein
MLKLSTKHWLPTSALLAGLALTRTAQACPDCPAARAARDDLLSDPNLWAHVTLLLLPFVIVGVGWSLAGRAGPDRPVIAAGILMGVGLGGFIDGIVLHQILQWHNMLSGWIPPVDLVTMKVNMMWDGLFHLFTWLMTALGLALLWRGARRPEVPRVTASFVGALLLGWGLFNTIEGVIDHQFLGVHHVHPGSYELAWDLAFLAFGLALILGGLALIQRGRE